MKSLRKIESLIEKLKPLDPPSRFEMRPDGLYGFKHGAWKKYTLEELTALKNTIQARYEQSLKRFDPMEIDVRVIDDETGPEGPKPLYKWPDGWVLEENGISNPITVNIIVKE